MTDVVEIADGAAQAFVLRPGDTLVVRLAEDCSLQDLDEVRAALTDRLGDTPVLVLGGAIEQIAAIRAGAPS